MLLVWGSHVKGLATDHLLHSTAMSSRPYFCFLSNCVLPASFTASVINQCSLLDLPQLLHCFETIFLKMWVPIRHQTLCKGLPPANEFGKCYPPGLQGLGERWALQAEPGATVSIPPLAPLCDGDAN